MRRPQRHGGGHERWMVSYADFMTLLFAFFVVLYSSSQVDKHKMAKLSDAISAGFQKLGVGGNGAAPVVIVGTSPACPGKPLRTPESVESIRAKMEAGLVEELRRNMVSLRETPEGLVLSLREVGFFDSGSATLRASSMEMFDHIATILASIQSNIRVEGHTDDVPIHTAQFQSNWELSTARATEIIRILLTREGLGPDRLSAAGYGEHHPVASNSTEEGRRMNRRVDIVIIAPHVYEFSSPAPEPAASASHSDGPTTPPRQ